MTLDRDQLEWIVQEVLRRLQSTSAGLNAAGGSATLELDDAVVATSTLEGRIRGVRQIKVGKRAIVTPAVWDLVKEKQIELVRERT